MKTKQQKKIEARRIGLRSWGVFENDREKCRFRSKKDAEQWIAKYREQ
jgi:hypothetical protein